MKKYCIVLICLITFACSNKVDNLFGKNRESFLNLVELLKTNNHFFFNKKEDVHRVYFTYVFSKEYEELPKSSDWNTIDKELYSQLKILFNKLGINQFYISKKGNLFFKLKEEDYFMKSNNYYLGFSEENNIKSDMTNFGACRINSYYRIENKWYGVVCSSSPAN